MATNTVYHCDINPDEPAVETGVTITVGGNRYRLDLGESALEDLQPYLGAVQPEAVRSDRSAVRAWALEQGMDVGVRGRISTEVSDAYAAAHPSA